MKDFVTKFTAFAEDNSRHMQTISLQYLILFKSYLDLNLKSAFSKSTSSSTEILM